ncbi:YncE family protein [Lutibacter sp.]
MKNSKIIIMAIFFLGIVVTSCNEDDTIIEPKGDYENGILIASEGPFGSGTGTVMFISDDYTVTENAIFNKVNNQDIGNILQSIGFEEDNAYLIANVSNKITVVNRYTFEVITTITEGLNNPRYFAEVNGKGYVTNWGDPLNNDDDYIAVLNLATNLVESTIPVAFGPEEIVAVDNTLYVAHQGGYGQNNIVSVISASSNSIIKTLDVGDVPNTLIVDDKDDVWVLSGGKPSWTGVETKGVLSKINTDTNLIVTSFDFQATEHPNFLSVDDDYLYYNLGGNVYKMSSTASALPTSEEISGLYSYNMVAKDGILYATDAGDYASNGKLYLYDLSTNSLMNTFTTGIIPNGIYFN